MGQFFMQYRKQGAIRRRPVETRGQTVAEESEQPQCRDETQAETDVSPERDGVARGKQEEAGRGDV